MVCWKRICPLHKRCYDHFYKRKRAELLQRTGKAQGMICREKYYKPWHQNYETNKKSLKKLNIGYYGYDFRHNPRITEEITHTQNKLDLLRIQNDLRMQELLRRIPTHEKVVGYSKRKYEKGVGGKRLK